NLDPQLKQELVSLGWTKLRELTRVLTLQNVADWVAVARKSSYPELTLAIRRYLQRKEELDQQASREEAERALSGAVQPHVRKVAGDYDDDEDDEDSDTPR